MLNSWTALDTRRLTVDGVTVQYELLEHTVHALAGGDVVRTFVRIRRREVTIEVSSAAYYPGMSTQQLEQRVRAEFRARAPEMDVSGIADWVTSRLTSKYVS